MAVADLSITTERLTAVEFSMPWMNLGISIVYIKPRKVIITITITITVLTIVTITIMTIITMKAPPSLLSFLEPFSNGVWLSTVVAIIIVALMTYVIGTIMSFEAVVESPRILRKVQPVRVVQPQLLHHEPE